MQFVSFLLLTTSYINLKQTVSLKSMSLPDRIGGSIVCGRVDGDGRGRGVVGVGGGCGGVDLLVGVTPFCMMLSGQSRLAEVHF
jgi:hypothetical protein